jgi:hypothetical protein
MRAPLLLPISIALLAAFPALAQDAPRVLFCSGPCFAVDANGVRTPAPKGTELRLDQRFETGPGAYAQVKLGPDAAMALGDGARVRFDQKNFRDRLIVSLDLGRVRMIGGEAIGKPVTRPVELHTPDGVFVLRNADIEARKVPAGGAAAAMTSVRVNAGEATLRTSQGDALVGKNVVQGVAAGKVVGNVTVPSPSVALPPVREHAALPSPVSGPLALPSMDFAVPPVLRSRELLPTRLVETAKLPPIASLPGATPTLGGPSRAGPTAPKPVLPRGELVPQLPIVTPTGEIKTLTTYVLTDPMLTTSATTSSLQLIDTSTTLSTSSLTSINLTTTTSTSLTDSTVTKISTSPTLVTTTTTTTSTLTTSPLITTTTQPITISPILIR